ncbi:MAG TPA: hypothetical protein VIV12_28045 [Streptosporangiaceae bacterium]
MIRKGLAEPVRPGGRDDRVEGPQAITVGCRIRDSSRGAVAWACLSAARAR